MSVDQNYTGIFISQEDYVKSLLNEYEHIYSRKHDTPGEAGKILEVTDEQRADFKYQKLIFGQPR